MQKIHGSCYSFKQAKWSIRYDLIPADQLCGPLAKHGGPVQPQFLSSSLVEVKKCVSITGNPMTKARSFLKKSSSPDDLPCFLSSVKILVSVTPPHLVGKEETECHTRSTVAPVH